MTDEHAENESVEKFQTGYQEEHHFLEAMQRHAKDYKSANPKLSSLGSVLIDAWLDAFKEAQAYARDMQNVTQSKTIQRGLETDDMALDMLKDKIDDHTDDENAMVRFIAKKWNETFEGEQATNSVIRQAIGL